MRIDELIWDVWNEDHIARHGISPIEVEEATFDPTAVFLRTRSSEVRRYLVLGLTVGGHG